ncbi:protein GET4-like isoform X2 [Phragmites australis]|uniref:protein GET4-like isoform X2 n=1 Tax=Phragmites australis TaxID=29695 RepID=UPI002D78D9B6|nr:protein GET4-like isoform X2 [Phragmites australis]
MSRSMSLRSRRDLPPPQKAIEKLENMVDGGNYYEAQQMYKSTSARYVAAQKHSEALDILQSGALVQLKHGQVICGAELAILFVDTLVKGGLPYNEETFDRIRKMYEAFPRISIPHFLGDDYDDDGHKLSEAISAAKVRAESCSSFLKAAIRWSAEFGASRNGSPELHVMLAEYVYSESPETDMTKVSSHFVRGNDPKKFASMLLNFMGKCYPGEDDTAIARGVLMYLSQGNLRDANLLMNEMKAQLKSADLEFPKTDLIQFIKYLLQTLERDAYPLFRTLRQKYKTSTDRDSVFEELLDEIAAKFYGIQRQNPLEGLFGDMFKDDCAIPASQ